jgi:sec-independent protein translocase protein TatA
MSIGFWQIAIVVVLVVLLFGRGKISSLMGDVAKGIKSFKKGMSDNPNQTGSISSSEETSKTSEETSKTSEETSNEDQNSEKK